MTRVYFVRHAQPEHDWEEDRTRPLTEEGKKDSAIVLEFLKDKKIDAFYCSPYKRSMDTIAEAADFFAKEIITDERLREREKGPDGNNHGMFQKRWAILNFYDSNFGCEDFLRIIDWMPYIIELDFESSCNEMESECPIYSFKLIAKQEHCYIEKEFNGK